MFRESKEYSVDDLIEHPILGIQLATGGIERRSLDLVRDDVGEHHRFAEAEYDHGYTG